VNGLQRFAHDLARAVPAGAVPVLELRRRCPRRCRQGMVYRVGDRLVLALVRSHARGDADNPRELLPALVEDLEHATEPVTSGCRCGDGSPLPLSAVADAARNTARRRAPFLVD